MIARAEHIAQLLRKQANGSLNEAETAELKAWVGEHESNTALLREISSADYVMQKLRAYRRIDVPPLHTVPQLAKVMATPRQTIRPLRSWLPYVAAAFVMAFIGTWLFFGDQFVNRQSRIETVQDIAPGGNRATLTLADGRVLELDSAGIGLLAQEQGVAITKDENGRITYGMQSGATDAAASASNTITTPRGGQYQVVLPDGTKVWLNAASTLKYPSRFSADERVVELSGEAYFDVASSPIANRQSPFATSDRQQTANSKKQTARMAVPGG